MGFLVYVLADVVGVVLALAIYDWIIDPLIEKLSKKMNDGVLEDQDVS